MILVALLIAVPMLDTPTPTPTPTPGPSNQPISSFYVPPQQPPWAVPAFPPFGTGTPRPTVYAATPVHATEFAGTLATATAQVGLVTGPIDQVSTPISGLINGGPNQAADDVSTGLDPLGDGAISFATIGDEVTTGVENITAAGREFVEGVAGLAGYSPWLAPIPLVLLIPPIIGLFIAMVLLIIHGGNWLINLVIKVLQLLGVWKPV
jgi:hypothetical protein